MKTPLTRMRRGALLLACTVLVAMAGYRFGAGFDWVKSLWMTVITISGTGFSEDSSSSPLYQLFTVSVILVGMSAAAYTIGGFLQMMLEGEIEKALGHQRMTQKIDKLRDHVIICGYGRVGQTLADEFEQGHTPFVVVEMEARALEEAGHRNVLCVSGDATDEEVLQAAGIERARALITALPNDAANVFITLTTRNLNPDIMIVSRADHKSTEKKLRQAGANKVVMPTLIGAEQMVRMITRPTTADLMELVTTSSFSDVELDEFPLPEGNRLVGLQVRQSQAHRVHGLLVVAVKKTDGKMIFNPPAEYVFESGDVLMVMGKTDDITSFCKAFGLDE